MIPLSPKNSVSKTLSPRFLLPNPQLTMRHLPYNMHHDITKFRYIEILKVDSRQPASHDFRRDHKRLDVDQFLGVRDRPDLEIFVSNEQTDADDEVENADGGSNSKVMRKICRIRELKINDGYSCRCSC